MPFTTALKSLNPSDISTELFKLLDQETEKEVLEFDKEFHQLKTKEEKLVLLAEFEAAPPEKKRKRDSNEEESSSNKKPKLDPKPDPQSAELQPPSQNNKRKRDPNEFEESPLNKKSKPDPELTKSETIAQTKTKRDPKLLEKWSHYRWIRLELLNLANQRAALNKIRQAQESIKNKIKIADVPATVPALAGSIHKAIQEDFLSGLPITQSIGLLKKIILQVVGTEHPTDPLSQQARDDLTTLANEMERNNSATENNIRNLLRSLQKEDSIPPSRRDPEEEVNRDIRITLDKLYDSLPQLISTILDSYKTIYGENLTNQHQDEILAALENLVRDCSWAGFDADGNENITPETMRYAIRLHRIRAAEKHTATLDAKIDQTCKQIERDIRTNINALNLELFTLVTKATTDTDILITFYSFQNTSSQCLINRDFAGLVSNYNEFEEFLKKLKIDHSKEKILEKFQEQQEKAKQLDKLTRFSGAYKNNPADETLTKGAIQEFQEIFKRYKEAVRENTDAFEIKNTEGKLQDPTEYAVARLQQLMQEHQAVLEQFPQLKNELNTFNIQLRCFGMTYGFGHIRQDSSVYIKVWNTILEDLKQDPKFKNFEIFKLLPEGTPYSKLKPEIRLLIQKKLLDDSEESKKILAEIYRKHNKKIYSQDKKYKDNPLFASVNKELERLELGLRHQDMVENIIISNCESAANLLEVESLLQLLPQQQNRILIVPLLEKKEDLKNYEKILTDFIKLKIQRKFIENFDKIKPILNIDSIEKMKEWLNTQDRKSFSELLEKNQTLSPYLKDIVIEAMVGFSDTERVSGLGALISVQQVQEDLIKLVTAFGLTPKIYHGPGGDPNRGGLKRRDKKGTLQGNARSILNTPQSANRFSETKFYDTHKHAANPAARMEFTHKPEHIQNWIAECEKEATEFYEFLHDTEKGLGKLLGFMLGQGAHWMVNILNSSSRATQRGISENHGDRTAAVQTGGSRPELYIHPDKPRAISATQMKEMLADNINLIIGPGFGLRKLGLARAERLYDSSEAIRDMVEKTALGIALSDYKVTQEALFASNPEYLPKDDKQRKEWAEECRNKYPDLLTIINIEEGLKSENGRNQLLTMMSRLFAYIEEEFLQTQDFLFKLNQSIHRETYSKPGAPKNITKSSDLLFHYPEWQIQAQNAKNEAEGLFLLMARQNYHVAQGKNLDEVYAGLNNGKHPHSKMTNVGRLVGNVGAGITAFRIMPPAFYEGIYLDYSQDLRPGVARAEQEAKDLSLGKKFGTPIKTDFFAKTKKEQKEKEQKEIKKEPKEIMVEIAKEIEKTVPKIDTESNKSELKQ